jgi:S1-C subfamily serine protease
MVTPQDGGGRLGMWTGVGKDYGVVFGVDGTCLGVARFGQFLSGRACRLIAQQIIRHGSVKRATLGVIVTHVEDAAEQAPTPASQSGPGRPGLRVDQVMPGSPAEKAGIRVGDRVASLGGEPVRDIPSLAAAIAARSGPTTIELSRDGRAVTVTVELQQK